MPRSRASLIAVCLCLAAVTALVFGRTIGHEFVNYDDPSYVTDEPAVNRGLTGRGIIWAFTATHSGNWHPITSLSHMLDSHLYGLNPAGHHLTNVLLHIAAVVLLFLVLRQMTGAFWRSAFVAAVFAIHPLRVESVAWVAERKDVLSGVFFMLTLAAYVRYTRKSTATAYLLLLLAYALGLMSKGMLVTLPFLLFLLDHWPLRRETSFRRLVTEKIPLLLLSGATCLVTLMVQAGTMSPLEKLPLVARLNNAVVSVWIYIGQMFWPAQLGVFYPHPRDQIPGWLAAVSVLFLIAVTTAARGTGCLKATCGYVHPKRTRIAPKIERSRAILAR